ncbi:patatin-like phospholipase [Colletotrichum graminicola]|uniref:Patatin-like phospholipase n=1 Tax=Colletotrichum graminicola (strain M1.001 / M2 / FGSC 10212) TaxID=645133 RepID=E3QMN1_COLGM|nr:patatin-like phospholipase [Colletotrichum graminicola M1.001]EFQ32119.1 patatin-like phospholipase [Colletotrichum graminicola M1.001]WDK16987.1 patatin-like phospholipase [Colletotrichum graminicola]
MLGRLEMSVEDCITEYEKLMGQIFPKHIVDSAVSNVSKLGDFLGLPGFVKSGVRLISSPFAKTAGKLETVARVMFTGGKWEARELERVIKDLIERKLPEREEGADGILLVPKSPNSGCKVFVTAVNMEKGNVQPPVLLRSYENPREKSELPEIKIWQAARATSAAPTYFEPLTVDGYKFVDGGLQANNPLGWLWNEVITTFGAERATACFLSLGTGVPPVQELPSAQTDLSDPGKPIGMIAGLAGIATNTEIVNTLFRSLINALAPAVGKKKYWRFSVGDGLCDWVKVNGVQKWRITSPKVETKEYIAMDDPTMKDKIRDLAQAYINSPEGKVMVKECANALSSVSTPW